MERSERIEYLKRHELMHHPISPSRATMQSIREALERDEELEPKEFASRVFGWDCQVVDCFDNVKILESNEDPTILIKMQNDPRRKHVAEEMENEAVIYEALSQNSGAEDAIPSFHGFSDHLGVALLCTGKEGLDFEDIGFDNLSQELKLSAIESLQLVSAAGVLHGDLELRNIVQSLKSPEKAKIIDFGRAEISEDQGRLQEQVEDLKRMLKIVP
jgi:hypothetical protein